SIFSEVEVPARNLFSSNGNFRDEQHASPAYGQFCVSPLASATAGVWPASSEQDESRVASVFSSELPSLECFRGNAVFKPARRPFRPLNGSISAVEHAGGRKRGKVAELLRK